MAQKQINLEEILNNQFESITFEMGKIVFDAKPLKQRVLKAMREACEQTVDLCKSEVRIIDIETKRKFYRSVSFRNGSYEIDVDSILSIKTLII
jgi:hypothetical protein